MTSRSALRLLLLLGCLVLLVTSFTSDRALARQSAAPVLTTGAVVSLAGTPHIWVADSQGTLHWAGDTRALVGRTVDWNTRSEVSLAEMRGLPRSDPWLSAGLLKDGDPIYLVKWETSDSKPTLLQIQSISDVELFGINGQNYGALVMDKAAWEQKFGMSAAGFQRSALASAAATPTPAGTATATPFAGTPTATGSLKAEFVSVSVSGSEPSYTAVTTIKITGATPRGRLKASLVGKEYDCSPGCNSTRNIRWGPVDLGDADDSGSYKYEDRHGPYSEYTYTIYDPSGRTTTIRLDDDFKFLN